MGFHRVSKGIFSYVMKGGIDQKLNQKDERAERRRNEGMEMA